MVCCHFDFANCPSFVGFFKEGKDEDKVERKEDGRDKIGKEESKVSARSLRRDVTGIV